MMKKKKRIWSGLAAVLLAIALAGCGGQAEMPQEGQENADAASGQQEMTADTENDAEGNTLVVYYSATGSTKAAAETIAETLEADIFEITPTEPYTAEDLDWTDEDSRVTREHEDESLRTVELESTTVENWESYDTVFIGYPIWWGIAAWPVDGFVTANDFTGKTVIPFCTSASSGLGESGELLAGLAGTGDWQEGQRFPSSADAAEAVEWAARWK